MSRLRPDRREQRRRGHEERLEVWRALTPVEQLEALDKRLHLGWSWRQRKRIIDKACPLKDSKEGTCKGKDCQIHARRRNL